MAYRTTTDEPILTERQFAELPAEGEHLHELVAGRPVREPRPGFRHGRLISRLGRILDDFVEARGLGAVVVEAGFRLSAEPLTIRGPDIAFVRAARLPRDPVGFFHGPPDLAVEIVSPSNRAADIQAKVLEYLEAGTRLVWVVYPETRTVVVHESTGSARVIDEDDVLTGDDVIPGLEILVARLFD